MASTSPLDSAASTDAEAAAVFVAGSVPTVLAPFADHLSALYVDVRRIGVLLVDGDGSRLRYWADSDGRVLPCPPPLAALAANPGLHQCAASGRAQSSFVRLDPALEWATGDDTVPLVTLPIELRRRFLGFLVVEANPAVAFSARTVHELLAWGPMAASAVAAAIEAMHALVGTANFARDLTLLRDEETGRHQLRLGSYARILAEEIGHANGLPHGFAEELALFAPLHDVGKVGIPDEILLKPGRFEPAEWERMKEHVSKGRTLVDRLIADFGLCDVPGVATLHAVVAWHHEYLDGSGYPEGLAGDAIPLASRVVTTVDIFDALTCERPYKRPWTIDAAFDQLRSLAGSRLDRDCVAALISARERIAAAWHGHRHGGDALPA